MQSKLILPFAVLGLGLVACQQPADSNIAIDNEVNAAEAANAEIEMLPPSEEGGALATNDNITSATLPTQIPAQYRGRWGMVAADCTSTRGDAKGLIDVSEASIKFYESRATLKEQRPAIATSFAGLFGFTGEGQTWEKVITLTRTGDTLKRADDEESYNYKRCA